MGAIHFRLANERTNKMTAFDVTTKLLCSMMNSPHTVACESAICIIKVSNIPGLPNHSRAQDPFFDTVLRGVLPVCSLL